MSKFTISADKAANFDPAANRVTTNSDGSTTTESGAYINPSTLRGGESHTAMPPAGESVSGSTGDRGKK